MKILLDTHIALWAAQGARQLSMRAREILEEENLTPYLTPYLTPFVSAAAIWEIAIKHARGNLALHPRDARSAFKLAGFVELALTSDHAQTVASLPQRPDHADPFDRIMVAQALYEGIPLLSADSKLWPYHATLVIPA
ncbi:MAG: type II toxin-antitoxin system VapC family toxin [Janthinobacterium lividum]